MRTFERFWFVWCEQHRPPTYKHNTLESARKEAERLATQFPEGTFVVLEAVEQCRKVTVEWQNADDFADLPF